jgi:hypothetical protein
MAQESSVRTPAHLAALGFAGLAVFQLLLAAGAPLGHAAWGGAEAELTTALRIGSGVSVAFYVVAAAVVLRRAGHEVRWIPDKLARTGTWALVLILCLSAIGNLVSQSPWERFLLGPTALVLTLLCASVARAPGPNSDAVQPRTVRSGP